MLVFHISYNCHRKLGLLLLITDFFSYRQTQTPNFSTLKGHNHYVNHYELKGRRTETERLFIQYPSFFTFFLTQA